jgi:hypothetical protein
MITQPLQKGVLYGSTAVVYEGEKGFPDKTLAVTAADQGGAALCNEDRPSSAVGDVGRWALMLDAVSIRP